MQQYLRDMCETTRGFELLEEKISPTSTWKSLKIRGIFQRADAKNHNGRIYPFAVLKRAIEEAHTSLSTRNMMGELDHPENQSPTVSLKNVSHVITEVKFIGNDICGTATVFDDPGPAGTPMGRILGSLIRNDCTVGISSRGLGSVATNNRGENIVEEYKLVTWDMVQDPSTQQAYVSPVLEARNRLTQEIKDALAHDKAVKELTAYFHSLRNK